MTQFFESGLFYNEGTRFLNCCPLLKNWVPFWNNRVPLKKDTKSLFQKIRTPIKKHKVPETFFLYFWRILDEIQKSKAMLSHWICLENSTKLSL